MADEKQLPTRKKLMDIYFFEFTVPHVLSLRMLGFFYMFTFDKHSTVI